MPKNRRNVPREERVEEIVAAATARFVEHGFRATSISDIARDVGIAPGAVHWYFPTKDDLFAAVFSDVIRGAKPIEAKGQAPPMPTSGVETAASPEAKLVAFLIEREPFKLLHHDAHTLLEQSEGVSQVHDQMHQQLNAMLLEAVADRAPKGTDLGSISGTAHYLLEGILSTPKRKQSIEEVISFAVDALVAAAGSTHRQAARS